MIDGERDEEGVSGVAKLIEREKFRYHSDSFSATTSGLGVLTTDTESPVGTETTVVTDLLQTFEVLTHLGVKLVGKKVTVLSVNDILLPVDEPVGDLELSRVLHDGDDSLELIGVELTSTRRIIEKSSVFIFVELLRYHRSLFPTFSHSAYSSLDLSLPSARPAKTQNVDLPLAEVDISLLADDVGVTTTNTLDLSQGVLHSGDALSARRN